jgi:hypothetical protein
VARRIIPGLFPAFGRRFRYTFGPIRPTLEPDVEARSIIQAALLPRADGGDPWSAGTSLAELSEPELPLQLQRCQPQIRYLLLEERAYEDSDVAGLRNVAAALFWLEKSRQPADIERVLASLVDWRKRVLLPARAPPAPKLRTWLSCRRCERC